MLRTTLIRTLTAAATLACAGTGWAVPTVFFAEDRSAISQATGLPTTAGSKSEVARNSFLAAVPNISTANFDQSTLGTLSPLELTALEATITGAGCVDNNDSAGCGGSNPGRWATSGTQFWEVGADQFFTITFDTGVNSFGFYGTDIGDFDSRLVITLLATDGTSSRYEVAHSLNLDNEAFSLLFWGFVDNEKSYTSIRFSNVRLGSDEEEPPNDVFAFDDMVIGRSLNGVPEPTSLALLGIALAGLGLSSRRRA